MRLTKPNTPTTGCEKPAPSSQGKSEKLIDALYSHLLDIEPSPGNAHGIALKPDPQCDSYYSECSCPVLKSNDLNPGGNAEKILKSLEAYWSLNDPNLLALIPKMKQVADALSEEKVVQGSDVDPLCYTLF